MKRAQTSLNICHLIIYIFILTIVCTYTNADESWTDNGITHLWTDSNNWTSGSVPNGTTDVQIQVFSPKEGPVIKSGDVCQCNTLKLRDNTMTMTGGSLHVSYWGGAGSWGGTSAELHLSGNSTLTVDNVFHIGHSQQGKLFINDNASITTSDNLTVGKTDGNSNGVGHLQLNGGTCEVPYLTIYNDGNKSFGTADITGGKLILDSNLVSVINSYIENGWLTSYGGKGEILVDYNSVSDKTIVTAFAGDFSKDKIIDLIDFSKLSSTWLKDHNNLDFNDIFDLDNDNVIGVGDLAILIRYWLWEGDLDVHATINPANTINEVSNLLMGMNMSYHRDTDVRWADGTIASRLIDVNTTLLRWPGGGETAIYHWSECPGAPKWKDSWETDPNSDLYFADHNECSNTAYMDINEFLYWCYDVIGAEAAIGVNYESGWRYDRLEDSLTEAVAMIQHCKDLGYNVKYWYIGNEPGSGFISDSNYADVISTFAEAMKQVDPNIHIMAYIPGKLNQSHIQDRYRTMLSESNGHLEFLDAHFYWSRLSATWDKWLSQNPLLSEIHSYLGPPYVEEFNNWYEDVNSLGYDAKLCAMEWSAGIPNEVTWQQDTMSAYQCAMINSEMFMSFMEGGMHMAALYPSTFSALASRNPKRALIDHATFEPYPTFYAFKFFSKALGNEVVTSEIDNIRIPIVSVLNTEENQLLIYLLNKTGDETLTQLTVENENLKGMQATSLVSTSTVEQDNSELIELLISPRKGGAFITLPGYSLTLVTLDL